MNYYLKKDYREALLVIGNMVFLCKKCHYLCIEAQVACDHKHHKAHMKLRKDFKVFWNCNDGINIKDCN